jgi:hypothetical protein
MQFLGLFPINANNKENLNERATGKSECHKI